MGYTYNMTRQGVPLIYGTHTGDELANDMVDAKMGHTLQVWSNHRKI